MSDLGWIEITKKLPDIEVVVVCTNGKARWLDKRTTYSLEMRWGGHTPTHWHPLAALPVIARAALAPEQKATHED